MFDMIKKKKIQGKTQYKCAKKYRIQHISLKKKNWFWRIEF